MQSRNRRALAIVAVAGLAGAAWGQVQIQERETGKVFNFEIETEELVEATPGSINAARIILGGLAAVEADVMGTPPGEVIDPDGTCTLPDPCTITGAAMDLETPNPSRTTSSAFRVGDSIWVVPSGGCVMPVSGGVAGAGANAGIDGAGNGVGWTWRETSTASADNCWRFDYRGGLCCAQGKTSQHEYGFAILAAIQTFEVTRPSGTPTTISTTHTLTYRSESDSAARDSLGADECPEPSPMCPTMSVLPDTVIYFEIVGKGVGTAGVVDSDVHQGAIIAHDDGTFDVLGVFDDPSFDPGSATDSLELNFNLSGLIDEVVIQHTSIHSTADALAGGDVDGDGQVCGYFVDGVNPPHGDRYSFMLAYGSSIGDANYTIRADFDLDGDVDATDLVHLNAIGCTADLDCDGSLTVFDQNAFGNAFDAMDPVADWDGDGSFTIFDYNGFGNTFGLGCM